MLRKLFGLLVATAFLGLPASANEVVHTSQLGDETIKHPPIYGFKEVQTLPQGVFGYFEQLTASSNKLLAAYVLNDDYVKLQNGEEPDLDRQVQIQTVAGYDNFTISEADFERVRADLKRNISVDQGLSKSMTSTLQDAAGSISKQADIIDGLKIGHSTVLAVDPDKSNSYAYTMLMNVPANDGTDGVKVVLETTVVRAGNKILYVALSQKFKGDITWVQNFGRMIAGEYMRLNPND